MEFDAIVIGAGAGGMSAAARLSHAGYKTLVVEAMPRIGGRASTREVDGFLLNTGALVIERGGMVEQTILDVGKTLPLHVPHQQTVLVWGKRTINMDGGLAALARDRVPPFLRLAGKVLPWMKPKPGQSTRDWLNRFTRNRSIHALLDNVVGAMFAATLDIFPAEVFLTYFTEGSAFKKIGLPPGGTIEVWKPMAEVVEANGGEIWVNARVRSLTFGNDGLVNGAIIDREGKEERVTARLAVSNIGPLGTVEVAGEEHLPDGYPEMVRTRTDPAAIITVHFASRMPLVKYDGLALYAKTRRMVYAANFSDPVLRRGPAGWHLYCAASVPRPATGEFDVEAETRLLIEDIRDYFPGFDENMIKAIDVTAHGWPAQRAVTGYDLPNDTPVGNLWNVGDGVKPYAQAGTASCSETARLVFAKIQRDYPLQSLRE